MIHRGHEFPSRKQEGFSKHLLLDLQKLPSTAGLSSTHWAPPTLPELIA